MVESTLNTPAKVQGRPDYVPYDKRKLSYANSFDSPLKANTIRAMEWLTGKLRLLRLIRSFERQGLQQGQAFWSSALVHMGIDLATPEAQIARLPKDGPVVVVANHPHGLIDGIVLAELVGRIREDYKILTRNLLTGVSEIAHFMIPVPFPHEENALELNLDMRRRAMEHLETGGVVVLFPAGMIASSDTWLGPAIEREWNPFTAKLIQRSGAAVVPIYFPGQNSRAYQMAAKMSATLRQGLLLHEVVHMLNKPQRPVVGDPIGRDVIDGWKSNPRGFVAWLRDRTLALGQDV